jgi:transcriptional regulator with XRE-family HTH domain
MATPSFADILRDAIAERKLSQAEVARASGIDAGRLSRVLNPPTDPAAPRTYPTAAQLVSLADVLEWNASERIRALNLIAREW